MKILSELTNPDVKKQHFDEWFSVFVHAMFNIKCLVTNLSFLWPIEESHTALERREGE